ncbi:MAG TPA: hypothetical protein VKY74_16220, partial [Chloroflexia bacterium]|nr:hypothetical protein [Chloroflexia bacterium]
LRSRMLSLVAGAVAFGLLAGLVAWQANLAAYTAYHALVDEGSVSVDAALQGRAAVLDHMGDYATYLATTGATQQTAAQRAEARWSDYDTESRISWRNLSDTVQGEADVFGAADSAASDYIQKIGAMRAYNTANPPQPGPAKNAFLAARDTLNTRLVPALSGLEEVKVEDMAATYAGASQRITNWRWALTGVAVLLALLLLGGLLAVRQMHYRWSWSLGAALLITVVLGGLMQWQLDQASSDSRVLVHDAYDTVAGVQDLQALLSQGRALESIAVFDAPSATLHLADFDQYRQLVDQKLCGAAGCTSQASFLAGGAADAIDPTVAAAAANESSKHSLPTPLIANVHFPRQAATYEALRTDYNSWLSRHGQLATALTGAPPNVPAAAALSTGPLDTSFAQVVQDADTIRQITRDQYDAIWKRVYTISLLGEVLALAFPAAGLLAAWGLWRRRSELFV